MAFGRISRAAAAFISGAFTGVLAGIVGLGGAELRIPFLLYVLKVPLREMIVVNVFISLLTSSFNFALRLQTGLMTYNAYLLVAFMVVGSVPGGIWGASISRRFEERWLKTFIAGILSIVVAKMIWEFLPHQSAVVFAPAEIGLFEGLSALLVGFLIGVVAGMIGVAGGEYRIPALMFIFGLPVKVAGTVSQLVSIPTTTAAYLKHRSQSGGGSILKSTTVAMAAGSLLGVAAGTYVLKLLSDEVVKMILVAVLMYTAVRLFSEVVRKKKHAPDISS